jgi:enoyl-CoA hydratase
VDRAVAGGLADALARLDGDPQLRVGVITGAGGHFCAGMDLKAFARGEIPVLSRGGFAGFVETPPRKPLIAAVEGYALAGGFEIALACDLIVAARGARFGLPEVRRGLAAGGGGLLRLPSRLPYHLAMELALTGRQLPAEEAASHGLVNRLVDDGDALAAAHTLAAEIVANAPLAVIASKQVIARSRAWGEDEMFRLQRTIVDPVAASADALEGATAFAQKRAPVWQGR